MSLIRMTQNSDPLLPHQDRKFLYEKLTNAFSNIIILGSFLLDLDQFKSLSTDNTKISILTPFLAALKSRH